MGDISKHFSRWEHACHCGCGFNTVDKELNGVLEKAHTHYSNLYNGKVRISITGPNRCLKRNSETKGASKDSFHLKALASDFKVYTLDGGKWVQIPAVAVYKYLDNTYPSKYGVILYSNRVHLDMRVFKYRGDKTK